MPADPDSRTNAPRILALEVEILRSLCANNDSAVPRDALLRSLAHHAWQDPEHRIVFEALMRLGTRASARLREELPAAATRMGFPDVDWKRYFAGHEIVSTSKIEALISDLGAASGSSQT
jgi:hypothetical protein